MQGIQYEENENVYRWQQYQNLIKEEITLNDISKIKTNFLLNYKKI